MKKIVQKLKTSMAVERERERESSSLLIVPFVKKVASANIYTKKVNKIKHRSRAVYAHFLCA